MCYEYDEYFQQALIEQVRAKRKIAEEATKPAAEPSKPAEPEKRGKEKEPVPA